MMATVCPFAEFFDKEGRWGGGGGWERSCPLHCFESGGAAILDFFFIFTVTHQLWRLCSCSFWLLWLYRWHHVLPGKVSKCKRYLAIKQWCRQWTNEWNGKYKESLKIKMDLSNILGMSLSVWNVSGFFWNLEYFFVYKNELTIAYQRETFCADYLNEV